MSLYGSLFSGVTGLTAQSRSLGTISENITNVNTVGFKAQTTHFSSLVITGGASIGAVGGVVHNTASQIDNQGILQPTENDTDVAIAGSGFFVVNDDVTNGEPRGDTLFTRAGHFAINQDRHLANAAGHFLMGWKLNKDGEFVDDQNNIIIPDPTSEDDLVPVDLSEVTFTSEGTDNVDIKASFPNKMTVSDTFAASSRIFDDLGGTHNLDFNFTKTDHIELNGVLTETDPGAPLTQTLATPAAREDGTLSDATSIDITFEHVTEPAASPDGSTIWRVTVSPNNGAPVDNVGDGTVDLGAGTVTFDVELDIDGELLGEPLREFQVDWAGGLNVNDSTLALDLSALTLTAAGAATIDPATLNESGALLKLDVSTNRSEDNILQGDRTFVQFDENGLLRGPESLAISIDWDNTDTFAPNSNINLNLGEVGQASGLSVGGAEFQLNSTNQDGVAFGAFTGVTVDDAGFVIANFKNGTFLPIFRLPLADFNNPNGLQGVNGNAYLATLESGDFFLNPAGQGGVGEVVPRSLEQSTVDIAREFSNMIVTQRAFSSASTVITTSDEMLQELVQIKR